MSYPGSGSEQDPSVVPTESSCTPHIGEPDSVCHQWSTTGTPTSLSKCDTCEQHPTIRGDEGH